MGDDVVWKIEVGIGEMCGWMDVDYFMFMMLFVVKI